MALTPIRYVFILTLLTFSTVTAMRLLMSLYALKLGAQPLTVGLLSATFSFVPMTLAVVAGKISDRHGARWLMLWTIAIAALGMLVPYFFRTLPALFVAALASGLAFSVYSVAMQNLAGVLSTPENRVRTFSNFSLVVSTTNFIGPFAMGYWIDGYGTRTACLYLFLWWLLPLLLLVFRGELLPGGTKVAPGRAGSTLKTLKEPGVWRTLATSSVLMTGLDFFWFYLPLYGHDIGLSASSIGTVLGCSAVAAFAIRMLLARLLARYSVESVLAYAFYLGALSFVLVPLFHNVYALSAIAFVFGMGMGVGQPVVTMLTFTQSAKGRSGEALGLRLTVNHFTRVVGPIVFGSIASLLGLSPVFWINAAMLGTGGLLSRTPVQGKKISASVDKAIDK